MKTYSTKANAKRAAKSKNINLDSLEFVEVGGGWFWKEVEKEEGQNLRRKSEVERPCDQVWRIADSMPGARRKDVLEACAAAGVAFYTARTQYRLWKQANNA